MKFQQHLETLQFQRTQFKSRNTPRGIACEIGEAGSEGGGRASPATHDRQARPIGGHRGACGAWPGSETTRRTRHQRHKPHWYGGRRWVRRARAGLEIDHSERSSRVAISRAAGPDGTQNTRGPTQQQRAARTTRGRAAAHGHTKQPGPTKHTRRPEHQRRNKHRRKSGGRSNAENQVE